MDLHVTIDATTGQRIEVADNGDGTGVRTVFDADGTVLSTEAVSGLPIPVEPAPNAAAAVLAAVETARQEVAGFSPTNGTRQAVEALATAVETLAAQTTY